jgi:hypothetical protein
LLHDSVEALITALAMTTTDAQLKVKEALLAQTKLLGQSDDPALKLEAAKVELSLTKQISGLNRKRERKAVHAGPQQD